MKHPNSEKPTPVEIVKQTYQPTKAEVEEEIVLRTKEGKPPTVDELVGAVTAPVEIAYLDKPKKISKERC